MVKPLYEIRRRLITLVEYLEIQQLSRQGISKSEIGRRLGIDRKTVRKYLREMGGPPLVQKRPGWQSQVERFQEYLRKRLAKGCTNGKVLQREIQEQGYQGSYTMLKDFLRPLGQDERWRAEIRYEAPSGQYAQSDWALHRPATRPLVNEALCMPLSSPWSTAE